VKATAIIAALRSKYVRLRRNWLWLHKDRDAIYDRVVDLECGVICPKCQCCKVCYANADGDHVCFVEVEQPTAQQNDTPGGGAFLTTPTP
jgi:hypothetical protein